MPVNRNALIRYKTIDKCLQNYYRNWTLDDLIEACSEALYEYEGIRKGVSRRTVQADIQFMRSDKLGYNAPIIVTDKKYYTYKDRGYSITNIPITEKDLAKLYETVEFLKQFKGFSHFRELDGMVHKLEDLVYSQKTNQAPVIDFEKNENLKGLEYLETLYQAIINKKAILLTYQSFKARQSSSFDFHPYLLKEFRNRWFIIGAMKRTDQLLNLALDRIISIKETNTPYISKPDFNATEYFKNTIGVSVSHNMPVEEIVLFVNHKHAPYVLTKPFHSSQKLVKRDNYGVTISLNVQHNFELEKDILAFGDGIKVIAPIRLRSSIKDRLQAGFDLYNTEISETGSLATKNQLKHKGYAQLNFVYTQREIRKIKSETEKYFKKTGQNKNETQFLLKLLPSLKNHLFNQNLLKIIKAIDPKAFVVRSVLIDSKYEKIVNQQWHQDKAINVIKESDNSESYDWRQQDHQQKIEPPEEVLRNIFIIRIHLDDITHNNGTINLIPGSHKKVFTENEIQTITKNSSPVTCVIPAGGIHLLKPLLLTSRSLMVNQKRKRIIQLELTSNNLHSELNWLEKTEIKIVD